MSDVATRPFLRPVLALLLVLTCFAGMLFAQPTLAQEPGPGDEAPVVEPGPVDFDAELGEASVSDFFGGTSAEMFLGLPFPGNPDGVSEPFIFGPSNDLTFAFDRAADTLSFSLSNGVTTFELVYPQFAASLAEQGIFLADYDLNALQFGILTQVNSFGFDPALVRIEDLTLNDIPLGDFVGAPGEGNPSWGVSGVDLNQGFVLKAKLKFGDIGAIPPNTEIGVIIGTSNSGDTLPPTADIVDIAPDPRTTTVRTVNVVFSEPVNGVDLSDFYMTYNGAPFPLTTPNGVTISGGGDSYTISGLATRNLLPGAYSLNLRAQGSGIADAAGNSLVENAGDSWERLRRLILWQQTCVLPAPDGGFIFTYLVDNPNPVAVTIPVGPDNHMDPDPDDRGQPTTFEPGETTVNIVFDGPSLRWTLNDLSERIFSNNLCDVTPPTVDIVDVTPDPRTNGVDSISITFDEPVEGFDLADLALTMNGAALDLSGATLTSDDSTGSAYSLTGLEALTNPVGDYQLTLTAAGSGIQDLDENVMTENASDRWTRLNTAPVAVADSYTILEERTLTHIRPGVLTNDNDPEGAALTAELIEGPANGTLTMAGNGGFDYKARDNFFGVDSFTYRVSDGKLTSEPATVTINVVNVNDAPSGELGDRVVTNEDTPYSGLWARELSAGPGEEAQQLALAVTVSNPSLFATGPLLGADGSLSFVPAADASGKALVSVQVQDDGGTANGGRDIKHFAFWITVLPVNDPPVLKDDHYTTLINTPLSVPAPGVIANDSDVDGRSPTLSLVGSPAGVKLRYDGSFEYTPAPNFVGSFSWTYRYDDRQGAVDTATVTVKVEQPSNLPTMSFVAGQGMCAAGNQASGSMRVALSDEDPASVSMSFVSSNPLISASFSGTGAERTVRFNVAASTKIEEGSVRITVKDRDGLTTTTKVRVVAGTAGSDSLPGSTFVDIIFGLGGDDRLRGADGVDLLCGGDGNDQLWGGTQGDLLNGGAGTDLVHDFNAAEGDVQIQVP